MFSRYLHSVSKSTALFKILCSKRLLTDHQEVLAESINHVSTTTTRSDELWKSFWPFIIACFACLLPSLMILEYSVSVVVDNCVLAASSMAFIAMVYLRYSYGQQLGSMCKLIEVFDKFDNATKRNYLLIMEMVATRKDSLNLLHRIDKEDIHRHAIESCKDAIYAIYDYGETLEELTKLDDRYAFLIDSLEDLDKCNLSSVEKGTELVKSMKRLYNIFLYLQSHCLLRLGLAIASNNLVLSTTGPAMHKLTRTIAQCTETASVFVRGTAVYKNLSSLPHHGQNAIPHELATVRAQSQNLTVKLVAAAKYMVIVDSELQNMASACDHELLQQKQSCIAAMEASLELSVLECARLLISVTKMLNKANGTAERDVADGRAGAETTNEHNANEQTLVSGDTVVEPEDEFFLLSGAEEENALAAEASSEGLQDAEELIANRQLKMSFRPVLNQLLKHLKKVDESFREREATVLKRKGVDLPVEDADQSSEAEEPRLSTPPPDKDDEDESPPRFASRFVENRLFLEGKQQIKLFNCPAPNAEMDENIFE